MRLRVAAVEVMDFGEKDVFMAGFLNALFVSSYLAIQLSGCSADLVPL